MFCFDFQPFGGFDLLVTGRRHFLLSERSLSFNNAMITLTSARPSARTVELASDSCLLISSLPGSALRTHPIFACRNVTEIVKRSVSKSKSYNK